MRGWSMKKSLLGLGFFCAFFATGAGKVDNLEQLRRFYNLTPEYDNVPSEQVTVAIFDSGFNDIIEKDQETGKLLIKPGALPASAVLIDDYSEFVPGTKFVPLKEHNHGGMMAQTVWAMTGNNPLGPKIILMNVSNPINLGDAITASIALGVDIIVNSQNFEYGGDFNGLGFLNAKVNEATANGILWLNAAGNYHGSVINGKVGVSMKHKLRVNQDGALVEFALAWNGTKELQELGTDRDLDLIVTNSKGELVQAVTLKDGSTAYEMDNRRQVLTKAVRSSSGEEVIGDGRKTALHPYERFTLKLDRNDPRDPNDVYTMRVLKQGGLFNSTDTYRLTVQYRGDKNAIMDTNGRPVEPIALDPREVSRNREIMVPADNPNVVTIGDISPYCSVGPTLDGRMKPEIVLERSSVYLSTGDQAGLSSAANAMAGGMAVLFKAALLQYNMKLDRASFIQFMAAANGPDQTQRRLTKGNLPATAYPTSLEMVSNMSEQYRAIIQTIQNASPNTVFAPYVTEDGSIILGVNTHPSQINRIFTERLLSPYTNRLGEVDFYLTTLWDQRTQQMIPITALGDRFQLNGGQFRKNQPWESWASRGYKKSDFIEVRQLEFQEYRITGQRIPNLWKTPTQRQLREIVAGVR
jgi:hypothetical protein